MGEYNDPVDYPQAMGNLVEALAHYLYDNYEPNPNPVYDGGIGDTEPWNTAGKRMREHWFEEADKMLKHFAKMYQEM